MIGSLILVSVVALLGMLVYYNSVRSPVDLSEYTDAQVETGERVYIDWVCGVMHRAPFGTLVVYPTDKQIADLETRMNIEFASAISRHTQWKLFLYRDGRHRIKFSEKRS